MKDLKYLLRNFYDYGQLTNAKSFYLYKNKLSKIYYYEHFYINFTYGIMTQNLNLSLQNTFTAEKLKEEFKLNNHHNDNGLGLFIFPNLCIKHIYTLNNTGKLNKNEKKILVNILEKELENIKYNFEMNYKKLI